MLVKFEVKNFKGFKDWFVFDLSKTSDYQFNAECVKEGVINKAIIYGANAVGKSNLGFAIFDIISHLTNKEYGDHFYRFYLNAYTNNDLAEFRYQFKFNNISVEYCYGKYSQSKLAYESLTIDNELVVSLDRRETTSATINLLGAELLNTDIGDSKISIINYIKNNTILSDNKTSIAFNEFTDFIDGMLFFRSLATNNYLGLETESESISADIVDHDNVEDFQKFLNQAGVECKLAAIEINGEQNLAFVFDETAVSFFDIASTGTRSLALFYFWYQRLKEDTKVTMVFIDEFDAYYHHTLSKLIVSRLKEINAQVILTTHNTSIMSNDLLRPDCYFVMDKKSIIPINQTTNKEFREAHNLEKMYKSGAFDA